MQTNCFYCTVENIGGPTKAFSGNYKTSQFKKMKPLRIILTSIRKQHLLDCSEEDTEKMGFPSKSYFMKSFCDTNKIKYKLDGVFDSVLGSPPDNDPHHLLIIPKESPFVWVLEGVKK